MRKVLLVLVALSTLLSCGKSEPPAASEIDPGESASVPVLTTTPVKAAELINLEVLHGELGYKVLKEPWSGDLDGMLERGLIRVLTVNGLGRYFLDGPQQRGMVYEMFKAYEAELNKELKSGPVKLHVVFLPVSREQLLPALVNGHGDIAAAGLTITSTREERVDFSAPVSKEVHEVLVTGPSAPVIETLDDLAGQTIHVRYSSSYRESLEVLSKKLEEAGKSAIDIQPISELLEDVDLLEMVQAGLLPWVVVDNYKAPVWAQVFDKLVVREDLVLRRGGYIGYAFRKGSPKLEKSLNAFLDKHRQGTLFGNVMVNRYFRDIDWVENALNSEDMARFRRLADVFEKYGEQYGFDYLMVAAQGYQESRLDQKKRSNAGAVGIMQLLPRTAADPNVGIPDIRSEDANIHAGVRYLDFLRKRYFDDPEIDHFNQTMLALAAYNAGPARVRKLRSKATREGLDPNVWFDNVEIIAGREIGHETVQYVTNIYKYYITYRMVTQQKMARAAKRESKGLQASPGLSQ